MNKKIENPHRPTIKSPQEQMNATFQDTLHLLAWNGYGKEAYKGSMASKETWTDDRILMPKVMNMMFGEDTLIGKYVSLAGFYEGYNYANMKKGPYFLQRVKHLLSLGANPDIPNNVEWTPLMYMCRSDKSMEMFKLILSKKVNVNHSCEHWCPLGLAASSYCPQKTQLLLDAGADPNLIIDGCSVLRMAVTHHDSKGEYTKTLEILLKAGADPNAVDKYGYTPIRACIDEGYFKYANLLLNYGAILPDEEFMEDAMEKAIENKSEEAIKFLVKFTPIPEHDLMWAIRKGEVPLVAILLRYGACPLTPMSNEPPLFWAIFKGINETSLELVRLLCKAGADMNSERGDNSWSIGTTGSSGLSEGGCMMGGKFINCLFDEYIREKNPFALKMIELFVSKLPSMKEYKAMIADSKKDIVEFVELNRIMMKARFK
jgi:ankyrin repeat protein